MRGVKNIRIYAPTGSPDNLIGTKLHLKMCVFITVFKDETEPQTINLNVNFAFTKSIFPKAIVIMGSIRNCRIYKYMKISIKGLSELDTDLT
ncbi:hypothetical protein GWI33_005033 [Rhynchophorus ferrugineus]|uniref:Uncharacterized protein n=1 Tax=Rhynchophorus ferrugineus TaxID=354439 RepID=A0A834II74_RHYFE|nr:hypothetical protein GWI33_005033 [Rhynchophorus ferrugineus]